MTYMSLKLQLPKLFFQPLKSKMEKEEIQHRNVNNEIKVEEETENEEEVQENSQEKPRRNYFALVCTIGVLLSIITALMNIFSGNNNNFDMKIYRQVSVLSNQFNSGIDHNKPFESVQQDYSAIESQLSNDEFKKLFVQYTWNHSNVNNLVIFANMAFNSSSLSTVKEILPIIKEIFDYGQTIPDITICQRNIKDFYNLLFIITRTKDKPEIFKLAGDVLMSAIEIPCYPDKDEFKLWFSKVVEGQI